MTFGEKLKKLRKDNALTQEELAERLYVTRTAVSKWELDKGFPAIDSLKAISELFGVSIDELISDQDVCNKRLIDERRSRRYYAAAVAFVALATLFTLLYYFLRNAYLAIGGVLGVVGYVVCALMSKPKYKRAEVKKMVLPYIISRVVILLFVVGLIIYTVLGMV